jgi:hypothetical protein
MDTLYLYGVILEQCNNQRFVTGAPSAGGRIRTISLMFHLPV